MSVKRIIDIKNLNVSLLFIAKVLRSGFFFSSRVSMGKFAGKRQLMEEILRSHDLVLKG